MNFRSILGRTLGRTLQKLDATKTEATKSKSSSSRDVPALDAAATAKLTGGKQRYVILRTLDLPAGGGKVATGPIPLDSPEAQEAIAKCEAYLRSNGRLQEGMTAKAFMVTKDELGMLHVRLDTYFHDVQVWGGQVATHVKDGAVFLANGGVEEPLPESVLATPPKLSEEEALKIGLQKFEGKPTETSVRQFITKDPANKFVLAYYVKLANLESDPPLEMRYMVDANTGAVLDSWNKIDTFIPERLRQAPPPTPTANFAAARSEAPEEVVAPGVSHLHEDAASVSIPDAGALERKLSVKVAKGVAARNLALNVDIDHSWPGDLTVKLQSPSGKEVTLWDRKPGLLTSLKGSVDLAAFANERLAGDWKLSVTDHAGHDVGTLNRWSIDPKALFVDKHSEDATPAPITDNATVVRTVEVEKTEGFSARNVTLSLDIDHTWPGDLTVKLKSPSGTSVTLWDRKPGLLPSLKETIELSQFQLEDIGGKWELSVTDSAGRDVGTLNRWSLKATVEESSAADDTSLYTGLVGLDATQQADGTWAMVDASRGKGLFTRDAMNKGSGTGAKEFKDANNIWGQQEDDKRTKAAVDAHYATQMTYDFYRDILNRDSIDGKGEALISNVHIRDQYVNAFWNGHDMNYGDGDGKRATELTYLDVGGHEITHGLTERTAGLIYSSESGGLNEAWSDIMGKGVEWYAAQHNPNVKFSWVIGERIWTPGKDGDGLRYMNDPTKDNYSVDNYKNYPKQTEVHGSSGIANNAFYLLVEGGTNRTSGIEVKGGIGMEKGLKIFGRALIYYMTPNTKFAQARQATIQAATDLYGAESAEVAKVKEAWTAVGVA